MPCYYDIGESRNSFLFRVPFREGRQVLPLLFGATNGERMGETILQLQALAGLPEWAKQFYSSKRWQDCRNGYAAMRGYLCENCLKQGIYKPGAIVHHVEELTPLNITNPEIALSYSNLELLCRECHKEIHGIGGRWDAVNQKKKEAKRQRQRFTIDASGKVTARV